MPQSRRARFATRSCFALLTTGLACVGLAAPAFGTPTSFTGGDLVVYQVTETGACCTSTAGSVQLVDYSTAGVASGFSVSLPDTTSGSSNALVESGKATNDGDLTLSADGQYLYATGYDDADGTPSITGVTTVPRTVAIVSSTGAVDTTTALSDSTTEAQNIRSATGPTGGTANFYNGGGAGVGYTADGASTNSFVDPGDTTHQLEISNGNLFESTTTNIFQLGTGLPSSTVTPTAVITTPPSKFSANGFAFVTLGSGSTPDTLYVADTANNAVEKYAYNGSTATLEGSVTVDDPTGLVASVSGGTAHIYITNGTGTNTYATQISELTDSSGAGGTLPSTTTVNNLVTVGTGTSLASASFHGLAWAPVATVGASAPETPIAVALPVIAVALFGGAFVVYRRRTQSSPTGQRAEA